MNTLPPLQGAKLVWVTVALSLAVFMQVLDSTIANVALPTIAGNLGSSISQGTWVITSFAVANAISIPLTGWLAKRFGEVRVFLWSTSLFVLASWLCGISQSLPMLIVFRIMQGAVAGPMIPLSQSLLLACYPPAKRGMALGLWSMVIVVAPIFGPILGGFISDNWHWGWIFFINIPVGIFAIVVSFYGLKGRESPSFKLPIDRIGLALLIVGVGALQMMLDRGKELDWFNSTEIIVLCAISIVCLTYLVVWEVGHDNPIIDLSLFKDRNFTVGTLAISLAFMVYLGTIVLLPLVLQTQLGYTAVWAGLATAPIGIFPVLLLPLLGKYSSRLDMRILVTISFTIFALCFFWRTSFELQMGFSHVVWPQFWQGVGVAMFFMPLTAITLSHMKSDQIAAAAGLSNFMRTLAGGIGTSFVTTLWERRSILHHARLTEEITVYNPISTEWLNHLTAFGMNEATRAAILNRIIEQQSRIIGSNEVFWLAGILLLSLIVVVWLAKPPFSMGGDAGGAH